MLMIIVLSLVPAFAAANLRKDPPMKTVKMTKDLKTERAVYGEFQPPEHVKRKGLVTASGKDNFAISPPPGAQTEERKPAAKEKAKKPAAKKRKS